MKKRTLVTCLFLILIQTQYGFSQNEEWDLSQPRKTEKAVVQGLIAGGEILLINGTFSLVNWASGWPWAFPTANSIQNNFTSSWQWENADGFFVNQLGHPFQGSLYFNAGRLNGFGFYESIFFSAFGSFAWETLFESQQASINDFITTVPGSVAAGEILYRLYVEAHAAGIPEFLAFFINPVAGIHRLLTDWEPPDSGRNLHEFRIFTSVGYAETNYSVSEGAQEIFSFSGFFPRAGFEAVYGDPFEQRTFVPFRHFEFFMSFGTNPGRYNDFRLRSDGYLFSFSPVCTDSDKVSTGLSLLMDFMWQGEADIHNATVNQYSNALDWTVKYRHTFSENTAVQVKGHAGLIFWGASKYYSADSEIEITELNNYGFGLNTRRFYVFEHNKRNRWEVSRFSYLLWTYPETSDLQSGFVYWRFTEISYSHFVSEHISLGVSCLFSSEVGNFEKQANTQKNNSVLELFVAWNS